MRWLHIYGAFKSFIFTYSLCCEHKALFRAEIQVLVQHLGNIVCECFCVLGSSLVFAVFVYSLPFLLL